MITTLRALKRYRRFQKHLRRMSTNPTRKSKYSAGEVLIWSGYKTRWFYTATNGETWLRSRGNLLVEIETGDNSNEKPDVFDYNLRIGDVVIPDIAEGEIRYLRPWEFLWHRDPRTGERMIGKNSVFAFWFGAVITVLSTFLGVPLGGNPYYIAVFCCVVWGAEILYFLGAYLQYRKVWR